MTDETHTLTVLLTPDELVVRSAQLAAATLAKAERQQLAKSTADKFRAAVAEIDETITRLATTVSTGTELQQVTCAWQLGDRAGRKTMLLVRSDTGAVIDERAATSDDLQTTLGDVLQLVRPATEG